MGRGLSCLYIANGGALTSIAFWAAPDFLLACQSSSVLASWAISIDIGFFFCCLGLLFLLSLSVSIGLNENGPHRLLYLVPSRWNCLGGGLGGVALMEKVCLGGQTLKFQKTHAFLLPLAVD